MDEQDLKIKAALQEKIEIPSKYTDMIQDTLRSRKKYSIKETIYRIFITILTTILGMSGVCFASVKIYNEYIKRQDEAIARSLINDFVWEEDSRFGYKIIKDFIEYKKYKEIIAILPEMTEDDFKNDFLLITTWQGKRMQHVKDMEVYNVVSDETTTYITFKQKENPNYDTTNDIIYVVISKEKLRDNIKLDFKYSKITITGCIDIEEISGDYSIEQAINDGCFVVDNTILKSNNPKALDEFIQKTENGQNACIRVYTKQKLNETDEIHIFDIEYRDGIYYGIIKYITKENSRCIDLSFEKIVKHSSTRFGTSYSWVENKEDIDDGYYSSRAFVTYKE